jgi:hypothetical protein
MRSEANALPRGSRQNLTRGWKRLVLTLADFLDATIAIDSI